jgi:hypothetical protein
MVKSFNSTATISSLRTYRLSLIQYDLKLGSIGKVREEEVSLEVLRPFMASSL